MTDLVSLVVQSKKALQQGESICSTTNKVSRRASDLVTDVLAHEARIKWLSEGVVDQLNVAVNAAHAIQTQRLSIKSRALAWDSERNQRAHALDAILESLAQQLVPPSLHQVASGSSLFGSQHSGSPTHPNGTKEPFGTSQPNAGDTGFLRTVEEIRKFKDSQTMDNDHAKWKSLRDFVDERGIDEAADRMDADRGSLDTLLASTASHSESILKTINHIQANLPLSLFPSQSRPSTSTSPSSPPTPATSRAPPMATSPGSALGAPTITSVKELMTKQDTLTASMAHNLESLTGHYDQMTQALRDHHGSSFSEPESSPTYFVGSAETYRPAPAGYGLSPPRDVQVHPRGVEMPARTQGTRRLADEDMQMFARDTEELPAVLAELEDAAHQVHDIHDTLQGMLDNMNKSLAKFPGIIDNLDTLADDLALKMQDVQRVETETYAIHDTLNNHLTLFDELSQTYVGYHQAYQRLLLEMDRRRRNRDAMEEVVHDMLERLEQMRDEELAMRGQFIAEQGQFLPDDLCPFVADHPVRWEVEAVGDETLPDIQESILVEARQKAGMVEVAPETGLR